ncbi:ribonuclease H-like domain-containing protein [Tepidiforma sp.]|uniref:ribonuclease H-like domain-containing protein n=1 Tax=Tepidiforma sp. TaxID=2682230 RepID=UPI002ADE65E5|nr:ribonuclease H-like domain-containing protein [Tepidiforma sp.]
MFESGGSLRDRLRAALAQPVRHRRLRLDAAVTERADLSALGGHWFETPLGPGYVIESVYDGGHCHGSVPLRHALGLPTQRLAAQARDPRLAEVEPGRFVYVDTETTGLGGAGTMVFLCGVASFEGSVLRLRQFLLPGPEYEGGLLGGLGEALEAAGALVSYNGKAFDLPALETRYILSRQRPRLRELPHLDLLHPNRRLFRGQLASHRLAEVERELLGFEREEDCPSAEVPLRYQWFVRSGDPTHLRPVLRHNAWDVLSLVALAAYLGQSCGDPGRPLQAARAAAYAGDWRLAAEAFEAAAGRAQTRAERLEALEGAARAWAKAGDPDRAIAGWRALIAEPRARRVAPYVELGRLLERQKGDRAGALAAVEEAIRLAEAGILRPGTGDLSLEALRRRARRLGSKVGALPDP